MERGDILFLQGKGIISKMVRYFDNGEYSHVAIAVSDKKVIESDVDTRVNVREFDSSEYSLVTIVDLGLTEEQKELIVHICDKYKGIKYDYVQLVWYVLKKLFKLKGRNRLNNPKNMICSELVWNILSELGILDELNIDGDSIGIDLTPNELFDLLNYVSKKEPLKIPIR